jgi:hypothetical protein
VVIRNSSEKDIMIEKKESLETIRERFQEIEGTKYQESRYLERRNS